MNTPVVFWDIALEEVEDAIRYYDKKQPGLGRRLVRAIERVTARISNNPLLHGVAFSDVRRAVVAGFPYCVYYIVEDSEVAILSVFHTSRDLTILKDRR